MTLDELVKKMAGIYTAPGIEDEPRITLVKWRVLEVTKGKGKGNRHLVGVHDYYGGRVSTAIVSFDPENRRCVTASGRIYDLLGSSWCDRDAEYAWNGWAPVNGIKAARDVSAEYDVPIVRNLVDLLPDDPTDGHPLELIQERK